MIWLHVIFLLNYQYNFNYIYIYIIYIYICDCIQKMTKGSQDDSLLLQQTASAMRCDRGSLPNGRAFIDCDASLSFYKVVIVIGFPGIYTQNHTEYYNVFLYHVHFFPPSISNHICGFQVPLPSKQFWNTGCLIAIFVSFGSLWPCMVVGIGSFLLQPPDGSEPIVERDNHCNWRSFFPLFATFFLVEEKWTHGTCQN